MLAPQRPAGTTRTVASKVKRRPKNLLILTLQFQNSAYLGDCLRIVLGAMI